MGIVYLVGAGPGAADLVTVRGYELLQRADAVVHDDLADPGLYEALHCARHDVGKRCGRHKMRQGEINELLAELADQYDVVVRLKGGDPFVLGRGFEELAFLTERGIECVVVPGVSSSFAAPLLAGIPLTHRGVADSFCMLSGHPRADGQPINAPSFSPLRTLVVLMGVKSMPRWTAELVAAGYPAELPVAFVTWAGRPEMSVRRGTLGTAVESAADLRSPTVAIVGAVVALGAYS